MINKIYTGEELEQCVKNQKREKRKIVFRTGLYYMTAVGAMVSAFAVPFATVAGILTAGGKSPFKYDDVKRPAHIKTEFTNSEREETKQYAPFDKEKSVLYYYDAWENKDNQFVLSETTYDISGLTYSEVISHIDRDGNITLGTPISKKTIYKDSITDEEKNGKPSYRGVIYECDENDFIVTPQTTEENSSEIGTSCFSGLVLGLPLAHIAIGKVLNSAPTWDEVRLKEEKNKKLVKKLR